MIDQTFYLKYSGIKSSGKVGRNLDMARIWNDLFYWHEIKTPPGDYQGGALNAFETFT
ncbi:hypothetical protein MTO98_18735 [Mucilaginibacter sp. SMC90]|uniref:hypothetical protein n=1 Tax=Mucilaginibacter sp. SMC90 TaxID=2929803 RepID=UPI001FB3ED4E|nr:hypothetical protein [Mucilaginibacter sp. SMC90]UOE46439.1 hypothetical protein MTO98_18735 [Mucilaginibacter sp. SMC90]